LPVRGFRVRRLRRRRPAASQQRLGRGEGAAGDGSARPCWRLPSASSSECDEELDLVDEDALELE
jgi:hypothetical protein